MDKRLQEKVSLRIYIEALINDLDVKVTQRMDGADREFHEHIVAVSRENQLALDAADKAISKSEAATEKRFDAVNEFRTALADQTVTFITRREFEASNKAASDKIDILLDRINTDDGQHKGVQQLGAVVMSVAAILVSIISVIILAFKG